MSFILDALKKSEAERQRQAGPALLEMRVVRPQRRVPSWLLVLGGLLILVNLLVVLWLFLRPAAPIAPAVPAVAAAVPAVPAAAPVNALPAPAVAPAMQTAQLPYQVAGAAAEQEQNPADLEPAAGNQGSNARSSGVQSYSEVSGELPPLRLDLHVYAAAPADRYAFINMHKVKEGDTTSEGMRVLEITRDGVVLSYHDTEFLLGRD
jgi:general secretion pathway protein B